MQHKPQRSLWRWVCGLLISAKRKLLRQVSAFVVFVNLDIAPAEVALGGAFAFGDFEVGDRAVVVDAVDGV